jgi:hypothetical protein
MVYATWSPFRRTPLWGYPADLVTLPDGRILTVYGHRKDPASIKVAVSSDGINWKEEESIEIYRAPGLGAEEPAGRLDSGYRHIGYPSAVALDDGTVLAAFHSFDETTRKQIVLLSTFRIA